MTSSSINWEKIEKDVTDFGADTYPFEECIRGEYIGEGAAMEVFEGKCKIDMIFKHVALKYHKGFKRSSKLNQSKINTILDDFRHEIKLMKKIKSHTNIVKIYGVTFIERKPVLIVELGNETLDNYLHEKFVEGKPASWVEKIKLCLDVLRGIRGLHDVDIIHGDIKGENILVFIESTDIVTAKISDFGYSSTLSSKGNVGGTMCFMAPEALGIYPELTPWRKKPVNDIFSFGLLTYQTATNGNIPYKDSDDVILARTTDRDMKILLSELPDDTPEEFRTIIVNTTKFMPADRASIDVVEVIIMDFLSNNNITLKPVVPPPAADTNISITWKEVEDYIVGLGIDIYPYEKCVLGESLGMGPAMEIFGGQCIINNTFEPVAFKYHRELKAIKLRRRNFKTILNDLRHEITLMKRTKNHPNILQLYGVTFREHKPILIEELAHDTLERYLMDKLESGMQASWVEKTKLCLDVLSGIQGLYDAGIIHGDIKGSNILIIIGPIGAATAKLSGFAYSSTVSSSGNINGSLRFMAPEALGKYPELKPWSRKQTRDIYNFGLVTYQIANNGKVPFEEYDGYGMISTNVNGIKDLFSDLPDDTPEEFRRVILNTTKFKPTDRLSIDSAKQIFTSFLDNRS